MENLQDFINSIIGLSPAKMAEKIKQKIALSDLGTVAQALHESKSFQKYCKAQLDAFLNNRLAMGTKDLKNIDLWWKYSNGDVELSEIKRALEKQKNKDFIQSDRYIDMQNDKVFLDFAQNIEYIQEEMDMPFSAKSEHVRISERQKIVDYVRFMEGGKSGVKALKAKKWPELEKEWDNFPSMPSKILMDLYEKSHNTAPSSDRETMLIRILFYRVDDINNGMWKPNLEEIDLWENYLAGKDYFNFARIDELKAKLKELRSKQQSSSSQKKKTTVINFVEDAQENEHTQDDISKKTEEKTTPEIKEEQQKKPEQNLANNALAENNIPLVTQEPKDEKTKQNVEEESTIASWQEQTLQTWQDWGKEHHKIIQPNKTAEKDVCAFKIFANEEKVKTDDFDADITYTKEDNVNVKGKNGKVPPFEVFEALVAQAKKNGPEIVFGDIKNDEFKANLLLACLNDGHVKMVNAPYLEELKDIPQDLRKKIEEKKKEVIQARRRLKELQDKKTAYTKGNKESDNKERKTYDREKRRMRTSLERRENASQKSGVSIKTSSRSYE